jgi:hypothetical protein
VAHLREGQSRGIAERQRAPRRKQQAHSDECPASESHLPVQPRAHRAGARRP